VVACPAGDHEQLARFDFDLLVTANEQVATLEHVERLFTVTMDMWRRPAWSPLLEELERAVRRVG
jgi:hypothetical protein